MDLANLALRLERLRCYWEIGGTEEGLGVDIDLWIKDCVAFKRYPYTHRILRIDALL
jgi:hypothetical protein